MKEFNERLIREIRSLVATLIDENKHPTEKQYSPAYRALLYVKTVEGNDHLAVIVDMAHDRKMFEHKLFTMLKLMGSVDFLRISDGSIIFTVTSDKVERAIVEMSDKKMQMVKAVATPLLMQVCQLSESKERSDGYYGNMVRQTAHSFKDNLTAAQFVGFQREMAALIRDAGYKQLAGEIAK